MTTHTLTLNNGALHNLAQLLAVAGLLTETADLYRAGQMLEECLPLDLPKPPEPDASLDQLAATKHVVNWTRAGKHVVTLSERQRDTAKKAVQAAVAKGMLPGGPSSLCLLRELGLAPEG